MSDIVSGVDVEPTRGAYVGWTYIKHNLYNQRADRVNAC